jgi:predicted transcriptional regulator
VKTDRFFLDSHQENLKELHRKNYLLEVSIIVWGDEEMRTYSSFKTLFNGILLSTFKYRDRASIMKDILETISSDPQGKTKTSIMRGANLNFGQANKYLDFLVVCDAIRASNPLRSQELARYRLTRKGIKFLRATEMWNLLYAYRQKPM